MKITHFGDTYRIDGFDITAMEHPDNDHGAPWDEECDHGPVHQRRRYDDGCGHIVKEPGELHMGNGWFYDYAEACRIARRDGWGYSPAPLTSICNSGGKWHAWFGDGHAPSCNVGGFDTEQEAISALYQSHRNTMSARAYAARAAYADYERLRAWCNDEWSYVGVIVTASRNGIELGRASLWGIESDAEEYLLEVAGELAGEAITKARAAISALTE